jgi:TP901-1 family phage major tail protein
MAGQKVAGVDVLVKIGSPAVVIGGQSGATLNRSMNVIETTDKTSGGWVTKIGGTKEWSVECEAFMVVGDAAYQALSDAFNNRTEVDVEIATGTGTGHVKFTGKALVTDMPMEFAADDAVTFSITLEGTGALDEEILA